jgi:hypothetical protein
MDTKRPAVVTIAAILLIVLSLFVAGLGIANQYGLLGRGSGNRQFVAGQFRNRVFTPQNGAPITGFNNGFNNNQNSQGTTPNFTPNQRFGTGLTRLLRLIRPVTVGLDILVLVLSVVAAIGLFKSKRWGAILAIVLAVLLILLAIPGMLRIFSSLILIENIIRILLAVAVVVLLLLPSARKSYLPAPENDL